MEQAACVWGNEGWSGSIWEISVPYAQFFCEADCALKNKVY